MSLAPLLLLRRSRAVPRQCWVARRTNFLRHFPGINVSNASREEMFQMQEMVDKIIGVKRINNSPVEETPEAPERIDAALELSETELMEAKQENRPLIYMPNWEVKLVGPVDRPTRTLRFVVSMPMTDYDVEQYLRSIYDLDILKIGTFVCRGPVRHDGPYTRKLVFEPEFKVAEVTFAGEPFTFPAPHELFPEHYSEGDDIPETAKVDKPDLNSTRAGYDKWMDKDGSPDY